MSRRVKAVVGGLGLLTALTSALVAYAVTRGGTAIFDRPRIQVAVILNEQPTYDFTSPPPKGCNAACWKGIKRIAPVFLVPTEDPPKPLPEDIYSWVKDRGIPAYRQTIRLTITSRDDTPVVITGIRARIIRQEMPPTGWFVLGEDPRCGDGDLDPVPVEIDLSGPRPAIDYTDWPQDDRGAPAPLRATKESPQIIDIDADPGGYLVQWELLVDYTLNNTVGHYSVSSDSEPLRVTALLPGRAKAYQPNNYAEFGKPLTSLQPAETPVLGDPPVISC
jgi:hypothetical protein